MSELLWAAVGAGFVLLVRGLYWLYWRYIGAGSLREYIKEDEEPEGKYRVVRKMKTPFQRIALVEYKDELWIYGNGDVMFSTTADENMYAEALVHIPMAAARLRQRILIIGGGGGVTTREALRYPEVEEITTIDIDEIMVDFGKNLKGLKEFNQGSLNNPKVRTVIQDGREFVENHAEKKWDVIIVDIPEPTDRYPELKRLFSREFYKLLRERLEPFGALSVACSASSAMPEYFISIQETLKSAGFYVFPYHYDFILEFGEDWGFCLASPSSVSVEELSMQVPTRYLNPERLKDMFHMPYYFSSRKGKGAVQTDSNSVLLDIVNKYS